MSGSEEIKKRLRETFSNSPMPDFEEMRNRKPSPLKPVEQNFNSPQQTKPAIKCSENCRELQTACSECVAKFEKWKIENGRHL